MFTHRSLFSLIFLMSLVGASLMATAPSATTQGFVSLRSWSSMMTLGGIDGLIDLANAFVPPRSSVPFSTSEALTAWLEEARVHRRDGHLRQADETIREALKALEEQELHRILIDIEEFPLILVEASEISRELGRYEEAVAHRKLVATINRHHGDMLEKAKSLNTIAGIRLQQGLHDWLSVERLLDTVEHLLQLSVDGDHSEYATLFHHRAMIAHYRNELATAENLYNHALKIRLLTIGPETEATAETFGDLGLLYIRTGRVRQGLSFVNIAIDINKRVLGEDHPWVAWYHLQLGHVHLTMGQTDKARQSFEKAHGIRRRVLGMGNDLTHESLRWLELTRLFEKRVSRHQSAQ